MQITNLPKLQEQDMMKLATNVRDESWQLNQLIDGSKEDWCFEFVAGKAREVAKSPDWILQIMPLSGEVQLLLYSIASDGDLVEHEFSDAELHSIQDFVNSMLEERAGEEQDQLSLEALYAKKDDLALDIGKASNQLDEKQKKEMEASVPGPSSVWLLCVAPFVFGLALCWFGSNEVYGSSLFNAIMVMALASFVFATVNGFRYDKRCPSCGSWNAREITSTKNLGSETKLQTGTAKKKYKDDRGQVMFTTEEETLEEVTTTNYSHLCECKFCFHRWYTSSSTTNKERIA